MNRLAPVARAAYAAAVYAFIFLPVVTLVLFSLQAGSVPVPPFDGPSLRWYAALVADGRMVAALRHSIVVGLASATASTALGFLAAYGIGRYRPAGARAMRAVLVAPLAVSYLVIGLGLSLATIRLGIGRSLTLVAVGHVVINLPLAFAVILSQMR